MCSSDLGNAVMPEVDVTWMATKHVGFELIAATTKHSAYGKQGVTAGIGKVASTWVLPPTLTVQYHFMPKETFRPYVGAGLNYTRFYSTGLALNGTPLTVDQNSWGGALQAGFDVALDKKWFLNFDVKKVYIKTDVKFATTGAFVSTLKLDPVIIGLGVGMKF